MINKFQETMALSYDQFIDAVGNKNVTFYKFLNRDKRHYDFDYKLGLNIDTKEFNASGSCKEGGLYFTTNKDILTFTEFGCHLACVTLLKDAKYYVDPEGDKFKTDKLQIDFVFENFADLYPDVVNNNEGDPVTGFELFSLWTKSLDKFPSRLNTDVISYFHKVGSQHPELMYFLNKHRLLPMSLPQKPMPGKNLPQNIVQPLSNLPKLPLGNIDKIALQDVAKDLQTLAMCKQAVLESAANIDHVKDLSMKNMLMKKYFVTPKI